MQFQDPLKGTINPAQVIYPVTAVSAYSGTSNNFTLDKIPADVQNVLLYFRWKQNGAAANIQVVGNQTGYVYLNDSVGGGSPAYERLISVSPYLDTTYQLYVISGAVSNAIFEYALYSVGGNTPIGIPGATSNVSVQGNAAVVGQTPFGATATPVQVDNALRSKYSADVVVATGATATLIAAPGVGKSIVLHTLNVSSIGGAALIMTPQINATGASLGTICIPAGYYSADRQFGNGGRLIGANLPVTASLSGAASNSCGVQANYSIVDLTTGATV